MNMVFCRGCGKEIHDSAPFCPFCGAPQSAKALPQAKPAWLAITSLALGSLSLLAGFGMDEVDKDLLIGIAFFASISILLSVINLQQQRAGKTISIVAIALASAALLICIGSTA